MIKLKGYTSWAVGLSVANISKALLGNMANVQAVSTIAKVTDFQNLSFFFSPQTLARLFPLKEVKSSPDR